MMRKRHIFQLIIILIIGFIPFLWFPNGTLILGHDSGLPFDPIVHFRDRLFLWSTHYSLGIDLNNGLLGSVFLIHGLETLLSLIGFSLQNVEKIEFAFWFVLPGVTMYYVAYKMWPDKKYLPLIAALIYMINYYLLQGWFAPERTKFSFYAGFPIFVYSMLEYFRGTMSWKKSVLLAGITFSILNGGGSIPLYGGLIVTIILVSLYYNFINFSIKSIFKNIAFLFGVGGMYVLLNAYWIIPYIKYLFGSFSSELAGQGGAEGTLSWTTYLSLGASFINLMRGQGIPDWYLNPYHAYAGNFLNNPLLILASFTFPLLAFISLFFAKKSKDKYYLYIIALIGLIVLIFASGTKSQLSIIYTTLAQFVPGFAIFRSAFFKFDYVLWFSYALMIGYTLNYLILFLEQKITQPTIRRVVPFVALTFFVLALLLYHYPVLNGAFFDYSHEPGNEQTTRVKVPQYVFDFGSWVNKQDETTRYLVLPELNENNTYISYKWGYWSLSTITSLIAKNSYVLNDAATGGDMRKIEKELYKALRQNDMVTFTRIAHILGINGIVLQKDYDWDNVMWGTTNPEIYEKVIKNNNTFTLQKTFGEWQVYSLNTTADNQRISVTNKLGYIQGDLVSIVALPSFDSSAALFVSTTDKKLNADFFDKATDVYISPTCNNCLLQGIKSTFVPYNPKVLPGSILYPLVTEKENKVKIGAKDFNGLFSYYLTFSDRRIAEAKWMFDSKQNLDSMPSVLDKYIALLSEFNQLLAQNAWTVTSVEETELSEQLTKHVLEQAEIVETMYANEKTYPDNKIKLASAYNLLAQIIDSAQKKVWATNNANDKLYNFDLPKTGNYQLLVKKTSFSDPTSNTQNAEISSRDSTIKVKPVREVGDWLDFGSITLKDEKNYLKLSDPTVHNLLEGIQPSLPIDTKGIIVSNGVYTLTAESRDKCFSIPLQNLDTSPDTAYKISFKYKNYSNNNDLAYYIAEHSTDVSKLSLNDYFLPSSQNWSEYVNILKPITTTSDIVFCNGFSDLREKYGTNAINRVPTVNDAVIQLQNISMYKVSSPILVLYQNKKTSEALKENIKFQRKSPVEYAIETGEIKGPTTLIMKENYGKYWQLCSDKKECFSLDDKNHFTNAGYSNAWYFNEGLSGNYTLYYTTQRLFYYGLSITLVAILTLISLFFWKKIWKRKK